MTTTGRNSAANSPCAGCVVQQGTHAPAGAIMEIQEPAAAQTKRMESVLIDGVAYEVHAEVAAELLRLHIELQQAPAHPAEKVPAPEAPVAPSSQAVEPSATYGMHFGDRILHIGGRKNAAGYIEFGSAEAVRVLVGQVLRDLPGGAPGFALRATRPTHQGLEPTMFWDADDPERCESSINNVVVEADSYRGLRVGDIVTIQRAVRLPNLEVRITQCPDAEGNGDLEWDEVDAAQAKQGAA